MVYAGMGCFLKVGTVCVCTMHAVSILLWREQVEGIVAGLGPCSFEYPHNSKSLSF